MREDPHDPPPPPPDRAPAALPATARHGRAAAGSAPASASRGSRGGSPSGSRATARTRGGARRLHEPRAIVVRADARGRPLAVGGREVEAVRESWLVEDRWWTAAPLRRRYWEVVTVDGRDEVVFRDLEDGTWHRQRA